MRELQQVERPDPASWQVRNRGILRGRFFLGAVLILAALITWVIGLTMSPHGDTVAKGTEYLRTSIITFKRNGAIGTLLLCAVAAWLLFPRRRPKWPLRDWALAVVLAFLGASSIYTLGWALIAVRHSGNVAGTADTASMNDEPGAGAAAPEVAPGTPIVPPPTADVLPAPKPGSPAEGRSASSRKLADQSPPDATGQSAADSVEQPPQTDSDESSGPNSQSPENSESDQNQE